MISLCYMVKNEILSLPESIQKMRPLVDEICIVDTGSTDGTIEYAKWAADKFDKFEWCDDFSAARNETLKLATKDYILVLDADEWIGVKFHDQIRKLEQDNFTAYKFRIDHFMQSPFWVPNAKIWKGEAVRMFKNNQGFKYEGIVHNKLNCQEFIQTPIQIFNFNYREKDKIEWKADQNKRLMDLKIKEEGWTWLNCVHYSDIFRARYTWLGQLEDLKQMLFYLKKSHALKPLPNIQKIIKQYEGELHARQNKSNQIKKS